MWPIDQKFKHDNALTWVMGFGSNLVWWSYLVVGSCSKSFKAIGIPYHALASQCPFAASKLWELIVGVWLSQWWWNLVEINHMIIWACTKISPSMDQGKWNSLHKAPFCPHRQMNFSRGKIHLGHAIFLEKLAIYGIKVMRELFGDLWSNINRGYFTILK